MIKLIKFALVGLLACVQTSALMQKTAAKATTQVSHRASQKQGSTPKDFVTAKARTEAALDRAGDIRPINTEAIILGEGFNVLARHFRNFAADNSATTANQPDTTANAAGQRTTYSLQFIENYSKLVNSLNVSAEASLGLLSSSEGSARLEMAKTVMEEETSAYLLVVVHVVNGNTKLTSYRFRDDSVRKDADQLDAETFFDRYGDSFVDSITTGGDFFGLVKFRARDSRERSAIYGELQIHSGTFQLGTKFASELEAVTKGKNVEVVVKKDGGDCSTPSADQIKEAALQFASTVAPQTEARPNAATNPEKQSATSSDAAPKACRPGPVALSFTVKDYNVIAGWPHKAAPSTERSAAVLYQLYQARNYAKALQAVIEDALRSPEDFGDPDTQALRRKSTALDVILEDMDNKVLAVKRQPLEPPSFEAISFAGIEPLPIKRPRRFPLKVTVNPRLVGFISGPADTFLGTATEYRFLEGFGIQFDPPIDGLVIKYSATLRSMIWGSREEKTVFGEDGALLKEPAWGPAALKSFTIWLEGPLAKYYDVYYKARVYGTGYTRRAANKQECGGNPPIEALKVCVVAKEAPDNTSACN